MLLLFRWPKPLNPKTSPLSPRKFHGYRRSLLSPRSRLQPYARCPRKSFKNKQADINTKLADMGYEIMKKLDFRHAKKIEPSNSKKEFIEGNSAVGKGLLVAGLDFYLGYPMTPRHLLSSNI
jgi:hypothetical protein